MSKRVTILNRIGTILTDEGIFTTVKYTTVNKEEFIDTLFPLAAIPFTNVEYEKRTIESSDKQSYIATIEVPIHIYVYKLDGTTDFEQLDTKEDAIISALKASADLKTDCNVNDYLTVINSNNSNYLNEVNDPNVVSSQLLIGIKYLQVF